MKKISIYFLVVATVFCTSCESDDKVVLDVIDGITSGAVLRTRAQEGGSYDRNDTSTNFAVTLEAQDDADGSLVQEVETYISFIDNKDDGVDNSKSEVLIKTYTAADFTTGSRGFPEFSFSSTLEEALASAGLVSGEFDGGDNFVFRFILKLSDGRTYTNTNANGNITGGSYFASPYQYVVGVKCIPVAPIPGEYKITLKDSFGDGWNGAAIAVTLDGVTTEYTIEDGSAGSETVTVPDGATELVFSYVSGAFDDEVTFEISNPLDSELDAAAETNPSAGEIILNICT